MVKKCTIISLGMFLGVLFLSANGLAAAVTKLNDIRGGQHKGYIRLVLDAEGARPLKIGPATTESVTIVYEQLELMREPSVLFRNIIRGAANVSHHRQDDRSVIAIRFQNPNTTVKSFYMGGNATEKGTYRLILDLYPAGSAADGPGERVPTASAKAAIPAPTPAPMPAASPSPQAVAETNERPLPAAVSFQQLKAPLPKVPAIESASQTVGDEMTMGEPKQGIHPAEPTPKTWTEGKKENLMTPPLPETTSRTNAMEQPANRNEFQGEKDKSITISKGVTPMAVKPAHILTVQPPQSGTINVMPRQAVSYVRKGPMRKQESVGLVGLTLKLLSIALSCLVILFLHRANKIATNRYEALLQSKHPPNTRPPR
jgi:hypothetical protein